MGRPKGPGIFGPYPHGQRWQLVIRREGNRTSRPSYATKELAERVASGLRKKFYAGSRTIAQAIDAYKQHLIVKGNKESSRTSTEYRLNSFFGKMRMEPLVALTPARAAALYKTATEHHAVDTHRNELAEAKTFLRWCVAERWLPRNPLAEIKGEGKRRHGKDQLRIDEARRWLDVALACAAQGKDGAVAALCTILLAVRAGEVVSRQVRDLDDDGRLLWIPDSKTEAGRRTLEVPELLRPHLQRLASGKVPLAPLFGEHDRHWPRKWVQRLCAEAGVPRVTAHGMRGLHSTISRERGRTGHEVAAQLGHASESVQEQSYVASGATAKAAQREALRVLSGGKR